MSMFEHLTGYEKDMISSYINAYAYTDEDEADGSTRAPLDHLLRFWSQNKANLFNMFGQKFILERSIQLNTSTGEIAKVFDRDLGRYGTPYRNFYDEFANLVIAGDEAKIRYSEQPYRRLYMRLLSDCYALAENTYNDIRIDVPTPDGKIITFERGCKPMRMLGKIAKAYNMQYFDAFRIWHSQQLNNKTTYGTLCLSIHPLDFMTMSDNECGWSSCMSWKEAGCYRSGTVECMNSPYVIVAYLKSDKGNMVLPVGEWNSKKWRSLFIIHDQVITNIKGYPYRSDELNTEVLNWLREIVPNSDRYAPTIAYDYIGRGIEPIGHPEDTDPIYNLEFVTGGHMYNDFGSERHMGMFVDNEIPAFSREWGRPMLVVDYSGESVCMHCGSEGDMPDDETELVCCGCSYGAICECCERHIHRGEEFWVSDRTLCCDCYYDETDYCAVTDERLYNGDLAELYLIPDGVNVSHLDKNSKWVDGDFAKVPVAYYLTDGRNLNTRYSNIFKSPAISSCRSWWTDYFYVHPSDLTQRGLDMFTEAVEDVADDMNSYLMDRADYINQLS